MVNFKSANQISKCTSALRNGYVQFNESVAMRHLYITNARVVRLEM